VTVWQEQILSEYTIYIEMNVCVYLNTHHSIYLYTYILGETRVTVLLLDTILSVDKNSSLLIQSLMPVQYVFNSLRM
jgi:hypothetical protein